MAAAFISPDDDTKPLSKVKSMTADDTKGHRAIQFYTLYRANTTLYHTSAWKMNLTALASDSQVARL